MLVTEEGITIDFNELQPRKVYLHILATEEGSTIDSNVLQS